MERRGISDREIYRYRNGEDIPSDIMWAKIRTDLARWLTNPQFNNMRNGLLDIAIVAGVSANRMESQDVDNIAKVVLDALKEEKGDSRFLFYDDHQVVRLLIYKQRSEELSGYNTDSLTISFRVHDPDGQLILVNPSYIQMVRVDPPQI